MVKAQVLDELGLIIEGKVLCIHIPFADAIIPLRVVRRENKGFERFDYGPLPFTVGEYPTGVIPARTISPEFTFYYTRLVPELAPDMWYFVDKRKVYHAHMHFEPSVLMRVYQTVPFGTIPWRFREVSPTLANMLEIEFGFFRGYKEQLFLPHVKIGWYAVNPTNVDLRTYCRFVYGEYLTEFIRELEVVWDIMTGAIPSHWVSFGGRIPIDVPMMERMLDALGAKLIKLVPTYTPRARAIEMIKKDLE